MAYLNEIPNDIYYYILEFVSFKDALFLSQVNKRWHVLTESFLLLQLKKHCDMSICLLAIETDTTITTDFDFILYPDKLENGWVYFKPLNRSLLKVGSFNSFKTSTIKTPLPNAQTTNNNSFASSPKSYSQVHQDISNSSTDSNSLTSTSPTSPSSNNSPISPANISWIMKEKNQQNNNEFYGFSFWASVTCKIQEFTIELVSCAVFPINGTETDLKENQIVMKSNTTETHQDVAHNEKSDVFSYSVFQKVSNLDGHEKHTKSLGYIKIYASYLFHTLQDYLDHDNKKILACKHKSQNR